MMKNNLLNALNLNEIRVILFDLDGTLYEDEDHFDCYAECLAQLLPAQHRSAFWQDLQAIRQGRHALRLGRVYDRKKDLVLEVDIHGRVLRVWTWQGEEFDASAVQNLYPEPVAFSMQDMLYMGDGWWPPAACGYHYGLESTAYCYQKVKAALVQNENLLTPLPGLVSALKTLQGRYPLLLGTNSDAEDTERIVRALSLQGIFDHHYTSCGKPAHTVHLFRDIQKRYALSPEELLSIGDNYLNDIAPLRQLGCATILIDPHGIADAWEDTGPVVKSMKEIIPLFEVFP